MALSNQRGDFYISDAVKIIIAVVLGALLLAALTLIFNDTCLLYTSPLPRPARATPSGPPHCSKS